MEEIKASDCEFEFNRLGNVERTIKALSDYEQIFNSLKQKYDEMAKDNRRLTSELIDAVKINTELLLKLNNKQP